MLNPSTIIIIASSLLFALGGCDDLNGNRTYVRELSNPELSAENPSAEEALVDLSHIIPAVRQLLLSPQTKPSRNISEKALPK